MYTNIPTYELLDIIENACKNDDLEPSMRQEILHLTRLIVTQNYFKFQDQIYLQKDGLAMGAPTSSALSENYLQCMENTKIFDILRRSRVEGYYRYVDDIFIIYDENRTNIEVQKSLMILQTDCTSP